jgi:hypothetical protein
MRYFMLIFAAFVVLSMSSCIKTYTCACDIEWHDNGKVTKETDEIDIKAISKKDAKTACDASDDDEITNGFGVKRQCEVK